MKVNGVRIGDVSQVNEWLIIVETDQMDLEDAIKDFINEVKDVVITLCAKMNDIANLLKVLMISLGTTCKRLVP